MHFRFLVQRLFLLVHDNVSSCLVLPHTHFETSFNRTFFQMKSALLFWKVSFSRGAMPELNEMSQANRDCKLICRCYRWVSPHSGVDNLLIPTFGWNVSASHILILFKMYSKTPRYNLGWRPQMETAVILYILSWSRCWTKIMDIRWCWNYWLVKLQKSWHSVYFAWTCAVWNQERQNI